MSDEDFSTIHCSSGLPTALSPSEETEQQSNRKRTPPPVPAKPARFVSKLPLLSPRRADWLRGSQSLSQSKSNQTEREQSFARTNDGTAKVMGDIGQNETLDSLSSRSSNYPTAVSVTGIFQFT
ncbi:hypothetical protein AB6A40_004849 [Gnathostoma spinigerum]|uniref:Uncharacterized protein n=1 Tax=Gnathostoma spinigerum TaxID=75299 RepID=A0ABD6EDQ8_9BILA